MNRNNQRGTFLIEALLAVATVAIIMTTVFPVLVDWSDKARTPQSVTCPTCGAYAPCYNHTK